MGKSHSLITVLTCVSFALPSALYPSESQDVSALPPRTHSVSLTDLDMPAMPDTKDELFIVTIDGGSATKKSPIARAMIDKFNLLYVETGAIYRALTHYLLKQDVKPDIANKKRIKELLGHVSQKMYDDSGRVRFVFNDEELSDEDLRSEEINANVAQYASLFPIMHKFAMELAQKIVPFAMESNYFGIILEGRTCGTMYFPNADIKFWFQAPEKDKIEFRRDEENQIDDPIKRDELDRNRKVAAMRQPEDAIVVNTNERTLDENIELVAENIQKAMDSYYSNLPSPDYSSEEDAPEKSESAKHDSSADSSAEEKAPTFEIARLILSQSDPDVPKLEIHLTPSESSEIDEIEQLITRVEESMKSVLNPDEAITSTQKSDDSATPEDKECSEKEDLEAKRDASEDTSSETANEIIVTASSQKVIGSKRPHITTRSRLGRSLSASGSASMSGSEDKPSSGEEK